MDVIEIRDPNLNKKEISALIAEQIKDKTVPDFSAIGPESLRNTQADIPHESVAKSDSHEAFIDLMLTHQLQEPEFSSNAPLIGSWIVRLRQFWNWMSTKWYVRPIIKQQSIVNGQMALLLIQMETAVEENRQIIADLEARVTQLESIISANNFREK